jgi:hypothetical protein
MGIQETTGAEKTFAKDFVRCGGTPENPVPDRYNKNP